MPEPRPMPEQDAIENGLTVPSHPHTTTNRDPAGPGPDDISEIDILKARLAEKEAALHTLKQQLSFKDTQRLLIHQTTPTVIGAHPPRENATSFNHPVVDGLDIRIEDRENHGLIAWIPVPLWPITVPQTGARSHYTIQGHTYKAYQLGRTNVYQSLATHTAVHDGVPTTVSLTGTASIGVNHFSPTAVNAMLHQSASTIERNRNRDDSGHTIRDFEMLSESDEPPFMPSFTTDPSGHTAPTSGWAQSPNLSL